MLNTYRLDIIKIMYLLIEKGRPEFACKVTCGNVCHDLILYTTWSKMCLTVSVSLFFLDTFEHMVAKLVEYISVFDGGSNHYKLVKKFILIFLSKLLLEVTILMTTFSPTWTWHTPSGSLPV